MTLDEFIEKYLGQPVDFDGVWGGQCVDLYRFYLRDVLSFPQSVPVGGAAEIWDTASAEYFDCILNDPQAVPQKGDIVIWDRNAGGGFGHVAIFLEGDVNGFTSLDENWPTLSKVTKTKHNYKNVIGWLRPHIQSASALMQIEIKDFERIRTGSASYDKTVIYLEIQTDDPTLTPFEKVQSVIAGFKSRATDAGNQLKDLEPKLKNAEFEVSKLQKQVLETEQNRKELLDEIKRVYEDFEYQLSEQKERIGSVYILEANGYYKVGKSINPDERIVTLQTASPYPLTRVLVKKVRDMDFVENNLKYMFRDKLFRGEWFSLSTTDLEEAKNKVNEYKPTNIKLAYEQMTWAEKLKYLNEQIDDYARNLGAANNKIALLEARQKKPLNIKNTFQKLIDIFNKFKNGGKNA